MTTMLSLVLACTVATACNAGGDDTNGAPSSFQRVEPPGADAAEPRSSENLPALLVVNDTDDALAIVTANADDVRLDRGVLDGALRVPLARELFPRGIEERIAPHGSLTSTEDIEVVAGENQTERVPAIVLAVPGGSVVLAVGEGVVTVRKRRDGSLAITAADPGNVALVPVGDRPTRTCAATALDDGFRVNSISPRTRSALLDRDEAMPVKAITRDSAGCRVFHGVDESLGDTALRVCIADAAYPFADDDVLDLRIDDTSPSQWPTWLVESGKGITMRLAELAVDTQSVMKIDSLSLVAEAAPTCARVADCGTVDVPATVAYAFAGGPSGSLPVGGAPVIDPASPSRTYALLAARARPVAGRRCTSEDEQLPYGFRARTWIAVIER